MLYEVITAVVAGVELFKKNLFSDDAKTTALTLVLKNDAEPEDVIHAVRQLLAATSGDLALYRNNFV